MPINISSTSTRARRLIRTSSPVPNKERLVTGDSPEEVDLLEELANRDLTLFGDLPFVPIIPTAESPAVVCETLPTNSLARVVVYHNRFPSKISVRRSLWVVKMLAPDKHLSHLDCILLEAEMLFDL